LLATLPGEVARPPTKEVAQAAPWLAALGPFRSWHFCFVVLIYLILWQILVIS